MKSSFVLLLSCFILFFLFGCQKKELMIGIPELDYKALKLGTYKGTFAECGLTACYTIDTTYQILKENELYYLVIGNRKDELDFSYNVKEFKSKVVIWDSSHKTGSYLFGGWFTGDSCYVKFSDAWGVFNNNLLSGKRQ